MVTVAIISIMTGSVVVGFGSFGQTIRLQETKGIITDTINNLALEMNQRMYQQQVIHVKENYLIVEAKPVNESLILKWNGQGACGPDEEELEADNTGSPDLVHLAYRDRLGNNRRLEGIKPSAKKTFCVNFTDAKDTQWRYQMFGSGRLSQSIRFIHFNIRRGDPDLVRITGGNEYTVELSAPYAAKKLYSNGAPETGHAEISVENEGSTDTIVLQN